MIEEVGRGPEGRTFLFRCRTCSKWWKRTFVGRAEAERYLRLHDVCPVGYHVIEKGLIEVVEVYM